MSLVSTSLQSDLSQVLSSMTDGKDEVFSEGFATSIADYATTGLITTVDTGSVSAGTFTGTGSGSIKVDSSSLESVLLSASQAMRNMPEGGDAYLASQMSSGIEAMMTAGTVTCTVTGSAVQSGVTSSVSGSATGSFMGTGVSAMQSTIEAALNDMKSMSEGGDDYFALQVASAVTTYFQSGVITTQGEAALSGEIGTGAMA